MRVGETVKYLKRGGTEKRGGEEILKEGGGAGWVKGWLPLKARLEPPYELLCEAIHPARFAENNRSIVVFRQYRFIICG